jgi:hypothetical protein
MGSDLKDVKHRHVPNSESFREREHSPATAGRLSKAFDVRAGDALASHSLMVISRGRLSQSIIELGRKIRYNLR